MSIGRQLEGKSPHPQRRIFGIHVPVKIVVPLTLNGCAEIGLFSERLGGLTPWGKSAGEKKKLKYRKLCRSHSFMIEM
jgi:hypothetical protein